MLVAGCWLLVEVEVEVPVAVVVAVVVLVAVRTCTQRDTCLSIHTLYASIAGATSLWT